MKIIVLVFVLLVVGVFLLLAAQRLLKTVYLIALVSPYEQTVDGAPAILVLGDSTGYGTGASRKEDSVAGRIGAEFPEYSIVNDSKNGRTIGELQTVVEQLEGEYVLILLQIGGNDIIQKRDLGEVERELTAVIRKLREHTEHIVMISSGNVGGARVFTGEAAIEYETLTREFRAMFLRLASTTPLVYVDLFQEPAVDHFIIDPDTYLAIDDLHPSSEGYALWYQFLHPVLQERL